MDFFEAQERARRNTTKLVILYVLAVLSIILAVYAVLILLVDPGGYLPASAPAVDRYWHPELFLTVSTLLLIVVIAGSLFRMAQLKRGGAAVAEMLGGRRVEPSTRDPKERQLMNVVEEMSIASGVPVPEVYILDREENINAFAAGFGTSDAAIGVTSGALDQLNRDELQGVIAHEYSHIFNGDMRLNIRLIGILNGILLLHIMGLILMRSGAWSGAMRGGGRGQGGGGQATLVIILLGLALLVIGYIGMLFGRMIQAAVSRQREYLADAAAVQYTRNPEGLAGALQKIGRKKKGGEIQDGHAMELSHLFFAGSFHTALDRLYSTHPPVEDRIRAIAPGFEADDSGSPKRSRPERTEAASRSEADASGRSGGIHGHDALTPAAILGAIGTVDRQQVDHAGRLLERIPRTLRAAAHEPFEAEALIYAMLLTRLSIEADSNIPAETESDQQSDSDTVPETPDWLKESLGPEIQKSLERLMKELDNADPGWFLPLAELALPTLRNMSRGQYKTFRNLLERLADETGHLSLFLFTLEKMVVRQLDVHFSPSKRPKVRHHHLKPLKNELAVILSALAHGSDDDPQKAWEAAMEPIAKVAPEGLTLLEPEMCGLDRLGPALEEIALSANPVKKYLLSAAIHAVLANRSLSLREQELIRALSESIDIPMPVELFSLARST